MVMKGKLVAGWEIVGGRGSLLGLCEEEWREGGQVEEGNVVPFLDRREPMPHPPTSPRPDIRDDSRACEAKCFRSIHSEASIVPAS